MIRFITLFISAILLTGCSLIFEDPETPCPVAGDDSDFLNLSFRVMVPVEGNSRLDDVHDEIGSENPTLEDRIYSDDFCFFIFVGSQGDSDPTLIAKVYQGSAPDDSYTTISGGPTEYIVRVSIAKAEFHSIVPTTAKYVDFRVVAFANTGKKFTELTAEQCDTYSHLIAAAEMWNFNIFGTFYLDAAGLLAQEPRIPMFSTVKFTVSSDRLNKSTMAEPVWGEDISMLRSLAKIKLVDNITDRDNNGFPYVKAVTFHTQTEAYVLPHDAAKYVNGHQVEIPRPYNNTEGRSVLTLTANAAAPQWTGYVPEQPINGDADIAPFFIVTVANKRADEVVEDLECIVPMTEYYGQKFEFGNNILRNHIYTLTVTRFGATLDITVDLAPYRLCALDPFFGLDR